MEFQFIGLFIPLSLTFFCGINARIFFHLSLFLIIAFEGGLISMLQNEKMGPNHFSHYLEGRPQFCEGNIESLSHGSGVYDKMVFSLRGIRCSAGWLSVQGCVLIYFKNDQNENKMKAGDGLILNFKPEGLKPSSPSATFNFKEYLERKNIFYQCYLHENQFIREAQVELEGKMIPQKMREALEGIYLRSGLSRESYALICALVLGDAGDLDKADLLPYSRTGTLHILSVSGLHVGIIFLLFGWVLSFLNYNRKLRILKSVLLILILWFFVILSGFSSSAVRAALLCTLVQIGRMKFWETEMGNLVFFSAFLSLCYNPWWLEDPGFQLSYSAILGIIYLYPLFNTAFLGRGKFIGKIGSLCAVSLAAQCGTFPISLFYFHQFPVYFLIANFFIIPISTVIMYLGIILLFIAPFPWLAGWVSLGIDLLVRLMHAVASFFEHLPGSSVENISFGIVSVLLSYLILIFLCRAISFRSRSAFLGLLSIFVFLASASLLRLFLVSEKSEMKYFEFRGGYVMELYESGHSFLLSNEDRQSKGRLSLEGYFIGRNYISRKEVKTGRVVLLFWGGRKILITSRKWGISEILAKSFQPDSIQYY